MSEQYEIQWPLAVRCEPGQFGLYAYIQDAAERVLASFDSRHPDPVDSAKAEVSRIALAHGPAWTTDEECGLFYRGSLIFSVQTSERAQSLAAHFNATGYLP